MSTLGGSDGGGTEVEALRRRVEELERRNAELRVLVDNLPIGLFSMEDPRSGRLTQLNPAMARTFGYDSVEACEAATAHASYRDPKERDETFARFLSDPRFRETGIARFESVRLRRDGTAFPALITVCATFRDDGQIARFDGAIEDLSERKRAERSFVASEERFRIVFESADIGLALTDMDGKIARANPALCRFVRRAEAELVGTPFDELLAEDDRLEPLVGTRDARRAHTGAERRFQTARGEVVIGYAAVTWLADGEGLPFQAAVVVQDVTQRRRIEDEAARAQKLESLAVVAGGIAHDFNNFLAAILGNISVARTHRGDLAECLTGAHDAAMRARDVTRRLLTFANGGAPVTRPDSLVAVAREAAARCLRGSAVTCVFHEAPALPLVALDHGQMSQVFTNLFANAVDAMPEGGQIEVDASCVDVGEETLPPLAAGRYVRVAVTDHGVGISPDVVERVFDPYFTTKDRGRGLGLATVHSIVKRHGGHVEARCEPARTSFVVHLPATTSGESGEGAGDEPQPLATLQARVLVMDDEPSVREAVARMLRGVGCEVETVAEGDAAIAAWQAARAAGRSFDVAILDLTVREGTGGQETMRRLRDLDPDARAVVSSGYSDSPVMSHHARHGFAGVVAKPFTVAELVATLARVLGTRTAAR